ncbi:CHASE3 domain-containing protein [Clostridium algoriphilum]|uniref:sensor histidine kinase n=1 Tax=Clostridium algoriphilum TaxID=198347 RepID=UPI001CF32ADE|nr:ATP-binding protein [Clostridium algoriphilum]MCB2293568.1 CHASE3 domain-containing protein [Clostridium algoriphilum]
MNKNKNISRQAVVLGCLSMACFSLIIIFFSVYNMYKVRKESDFISNEMLPAKMLSIEILTSVINQQTGIRAYIISKDRAFLDAYYLGSKKMQGYSESIDNLRAIGIDADTTNQLNNEMLLIQTYFKQQIVLINNGKLSESKLDLNKGENLVDKFSAADKELINEIDSKINNSRKVVANTQTIHQHLLIFLGIILIACNYIFISHIWSGMHQQIKKKNEINEDLQKLLSLQEEYIANISHEFKTPLNVILAAAQLLDVYCDGGLLDEKKNLTVKHIDSIKRNSYRLSKLINNIVDLSKIEAGFFKLNLSNNNIVEVVEDMVMSVTDFTESKGLHIIFDTDIEEKIIACDPEKIDKIVLNLISNAIKFSNKGDEIFVDVKDEIEYVEVSVQDTGIGIEHKYLDTIFDKFNQVDKSLSRNAEGTGVGLSLVKSIIEMAGGSINVESEIGIGSKFTVKFPSKKVLQENIQFDNVMRNGKEKIKEEFSDVY